MIIIPGCSCTGIQDQAHHSCECQLRTRLCPAYCELKHECQLQHWHQLQYNHKLKQQHQLQHQRPFHFVRLCDHSYLALPRIIVESVASATRSKPSDCFYSISYKYFAFFVKPDTGERSRVVRASLSLSTSVLSWYLRCLHFNDIWGIWGKIFCPLYITSQTLVDILTIPINSFLLETNSTRFFLWRW